MDNRILSALNGLNVSEMTRAEWLAVGMALKEEGYPVSVWDEWSKNDKRYHAGECERLWKGFNGSAKPVKGGTIVQMAKEHGWTPWGEDDPMGWEDEISYDGMDNTGTVRTAMDAKTGNGSVGSAGAAVGVPGNGSAGNPGTAAGYLSPEMLAGSCADGPSSEELIRYLETLFDPGDYVGYVSNEVWQNEDGKWVPRKGCYSRTAGELIEALKRNPKDIGAVIGDWKKEAGAWIRFNALDGKGVKNENVAKYRFALVESDEIPIAEQDALYRRLELPIAALVFSGGKSLHAIVHIDAEGPEEYRQRVDFLYGYLADHGLPVDKQNRNASRLSRMPGVTRNGKRQFLAGVGLGRKSWADWMDFVEGVSDDLPEMEALSAYVGHPPKLPEELISGILRVGHKMLLSGPSKAGKSFLLMELCIAIAEGIPWLGFPCRKGRVLYINLEIDPASAIDRFLKIYEAMGVQPAHAEDIVVWNLRGHAVPLDRLVPKIIRRIRNQHFDAIVLDPIYKVITGDENNASEMGAFCNQFDKICTATGCAAIYCHHHSKGAQGAKKAMDRASGSGVFARDPDAQLDVIELELSEEIINNVRDGNATGWRLESSLREFPNITPREFWFEYPIHRVDDDEYLKPMPATGSFEAGKMKNKRSKTSQEADEEFRRAFECVGMGRKSVPIMEIGEYLGLAEKTMYRRVNKLKKEFKVKNCMVTRQETKKNQGSEDDLADS